jgi:hypothetical protein
MDLSQVCIDAAEGVANAEQLMHVEALQHLLLLAPCRSMVVAVPVASATGVHDHAVSQHRR